MMRDEKFQFFRENSDILNFPFKLKRLSIQRKSNSFLENSQDIFQKLQLFLKFQESSLERLEIDYLPSQQTIEFIFNEMKSLKHLKIKSNEKMEKFQLTKNSSLISLSLNQFSLENVKEILSAMSEIQNFMTPSLQLTKSLLEFIVTNVKSMRKLFYFEIEEGCIRYYDELKSNNDCVNKNLELVWMLS